MMRLPLCNWNSEMIHFGAHDPFWVVFSFITLRIPKKKPQYLPFDNYKIHINTFLNPRFHTPAPHRMQTQNLQDSWCCHSNQRKCLLQMGGQWANSSVKSLKTKKKQTKIICSKNWAKFRVTKYCPFWVDTPQFFWFSGGNTRIVKREHESIFVKFSMISWIPICCCEPPENGIICSFHNCYCGSMQNITFLMKIYWRETIFSNKKNSHCEEFFLEVTNLGS